VIREDYLLRLIEELGAFLRKLFDAGADSRNRSENVETPSPGYTKLEEVCRQGVGLSYSMLRQMAPETVLQLFRSGGVNWIERCFFVAVLFDSDARISLNQSDTVRGTEAAARALYLYEQLRVEPVARDIYEVDTRIAELRALLAATRSPQDN
jgi:hypothetical protein